MNTKHAQSKTFSNLEVAAFCSQIALILKSGISSVEGIAIMLEDTQDAEEREILEALLAQGQESGSLYAALSSSGLFPAYMLHMVRIGEETGTLDQVMEALSRHYDREDSILKSIRNSTAYPMAMAGMMIAVIIILLVKVMPIFNQVFIQLGTEMTGFSRALMHLGEAINRYSILLIVLLVLIAAATLLGSRTEGGRQFFRRIGARFPMMRKIREQTAACRFASGMALTLSSGLDPQRSMELVSDLNEDPLFQTKLDACKKLVDEGEDMANALHSSGIFTGIYARMASIGFRTGSPEQVMSDIAQLYQDDIDTRMNRFLSVLEPTLVITLSLIVGMILLSVMLPLMGIMSSL